MTVHAAKGLEFPVVYVPGLQKDVFPPRNRGSVIPEIGGLVHGPLGDEQQEERYLLYVAMTRAQDRLVLSRVARKGDKAIARSILLPSDPPWPVRSISAVSRCRPRRGETRLRGVPVQHAIVAATSIDTYEKCPRRYMYQYGYQLYDDATPFLRMHQTIRDVIDELTEMAQIGALPPDEDALERLVWHWFRRHQLDDVLYKDDYFAEAFRHVERIWRDIRDDPAVAQAANRHFVVQRPAGQVMVRVDRVDETAEGVRYIQLKSSRPGKDDHLSTRIMLYTLAAQTHHPNATLAIQYTSTDETHLVEHRKHTLENHTAKIDATLAGIAAESWEPKYGEHCTTCPFNLICPV
jgi:DNA helicase-2/ATP-dependent DNA helicase PcrA